VVDEAWVLPFEGSEASGEGLREALCTLGNGYLATRGATPESVADGVHYPGTYAAGCYNRLRDSVAGQTIENESLVNLPNWLPMTFRVGDGPWLGQAGADVFDEHRELDLRRGLLTRRLRVRDGAGRTTLVTQERFVHMRHPHLCCLRTTIVAEDWSGVLRVRSWLDGTVQNTGVERYRGLSGGHLVVDSAETLGDDTALLVVHTNRSGIRIAEAARTRVVCPGSPEGATPRVFREPGRIGHEIAIEISVGQHATAEKVVTVFTSRDVAIADPAAEAVQQLTWAGDVEALLADHIVAWRDRWRRYRIALRGGGDRSLPVLRLHLFHVLQTVSEHSIDLDAGVPARGLSGEAYRGHVLWDELFVFPILNLREPLVTRALLRYRYRRLPWARQIARAAGMRGAAYPWQSGSDGREESQHLHLNPLSGRWVVDPTWRQRHIGLAVAYNVWQYYQVSEDHRFLNQYGAEMILEIARFFADLSTYDDTRHRYVIRGVMGPDEFHTGYPEAPDQGVDNNAYTNVLAVWVLLRALEVLRLLPDRRRAELADALGLHSDETERWDRISRRMYVPFHDGVITQFEGYESLAEFDWDGHRARYGDIRRLDRILESQGDTPNRYKVSKQADVLMLFYLLSADELGGLFDRLGYAVQPDTIPKTIDYYLARTTHGSTLSAIVHAWVLARTHREQAMAYFVEALEADVADVQGGTSPEGIHLAAMAGSVDILQRCFAGVETRDDALWLNPYWPSELGTIEFDLVYREHPLTLRITGRSVRVSAGPGMQHPVAVHCRDQTSIIGAGQTAEFRASTSLDPAEPKTDPERPVDGDESASRRSDAV
jgi:trehalose/maltose hydrolase-like predicted phosphorylase